MSTSDNFERDLLIKFREALAECKRQPTRFEQVEILLYGAIGVLEREISEGDK